MFEMSDKTKLLLDLFLDAEYGDEFTYAEIAEKTGCDVASADRQRVYSVNRVLERDHLRSLLNLRGRGYKVAHPREHVDSMSVRRQRAGTQIERAARTGDATRIDLLGPADMRSLTDARVWVSRVEQALRHHDARLERLERVLGVETPREVEGTAEDASAGVDGPVAGGA
jgi:hypothetical protein